MRGRIDGSGADPMGECGYLPLSRAEALRRLGSVAVGRIVFTERALPAIRPVHHLLDTDGAIIIRSHLGSTVLNAVDAVVAYQADLLESTDRIGWSVTVTGMARQAGSPELLERLPRRWLGREPVRVIRVEPELVTGFALADGSGD
ncbi:pyridoxamine 5'-phosphate oxidase family protein [Amycolatopsis aidingensis]|uniref:pyridoxamine 5'-phosphate oxidase family protein n=1 Tax=Amycolatopsis aidingensis TaxID=2842453 RepID=UPI001E44FB5A|nr:pyridoxamine 5'-phosphate oxidase family protein [Amycolatopsis aidingensis]